MLIYCMLIGRKQNELCIPGTVPMVRYRSCVAESTTLAEMMTGRYNDERHISRLGIQRPSCRTPIMDLAGFVRWNDGGGQRPPRGTSTRMRTMKAFSALTMFESAGFQRHCREAFLMEVCQLLSRINSSSVFHVMEAHWYVTCCKK